MRWETESERDAVTPRKCGVVYVGDSEDWVEMIECLHVCRLPVWLSEVRK